MNVTFLLDDLWIVPKNALLHNTLRYAQAIYRYPQR